LLQKIHLANTYIDIVNETLEYFVANGLMIDGFQGFDTGDRVASAELIAAPQNVNDATLAAAVRSWEATSAIVYA